MLSTTISTQQDAGSASDNEVKAGDPTKFHNWAGKGAAQVILPDLAEEGSEDESSENESFDKSL